MSSLRRYFRLLLTGFCMGAADVVPGVSGGTMAFILGIYEELIDAIRAFGQKVFWVDFLRGRWRRAFADIDGPFLVAVVLGIALAIFTLAGALEFLLRTQQLLVWSFFFGLVLASVHVVSQRIRSWRASHLTALVIGAASAYLIVGLVPVDTPTAPWFLILSGAIAICAMILPGISGAFVLVLLGKYEFVLQAVVERDVLTLVYVGLGAVVGLIGFSQILSWLLHHHHDRTVAFLMGLMIGSLRKIWPWKGAADLNILPEINGELAVGLLAMIVGFIVVLFLEWLAHQQKAS